MSSIELQKLGKKKTLRRKVSITAPAPFLANSTTTMTLRPANNSLRFIFADGKEKVVVPVDSKHAKEAGDDEHTTLLANSKGEVKAVEHILSALAGNGIDACEIELEGSSQVPVPDASAEEFSGKLWGNTKETSEDRVVAVVREPIYFSSGASMAILQPSPKTIVSALIQFAEPIGEQYFQIDLTPESYQKEISWARTFIRRSCDEEVWKVCRRIIPALPEDIRQSPVLVFRDKKWVVKPKPLEPVRHKILDAIGDLATLGFPILGSVTLIRPGHDFNRRLVQHLASLIQ